MKTRIMCVHIQALLSDTEPGCDRIIVPTIAAMLWCSIPSTLITKLDSNKYNFGVLSAKPTRASSFEA